MDHEVRDEAVEGRAIVPGRGAESEEVVSRLRTGLAEQLELDRAVGGVEGDGHVELFVPDQIFGCISSFSWPYSSNCCQTWDRARTLELIVFGDLENDGAQQLASALRGSVHGNHAALGCCRSANVHRASAARPNSPSPGRVGVVEAVSAANGATR